MTSNVSVAWNLFHTTVGETNILGTSLIIPLLIMLLTMLLITRSVGKWKEIALPVMAALTIVGLQYNIVLYSIAALMSAISALIIGGQGEPLKAAKEMLPTKYFKERAERKTKAAKWLQAFTGQAAVARAYADEGKAGLLGKSEKLAKQHAEATTKLQQKLDRQGTRIGKFKRNIGEKIRIFQQTPKIFTKDTRTYVDPTQYTTIPLLRRKLKKRFHDRILRK